LETNRIGDGAGAVRGSIGRLPHRPPFRFLTNVLRLDIGREGAGEWSVAGDEDFFAGHFPGDPVVPGVLIVEALAQLSGLVCLHTGGSDCGSNGRGGRLVHADIRFDSAVVPPAVIELNSKLSTTMQSLRRCEVSASANGLIVARGSLVLSERGQT